MKVSIIGTGYVGLVSGACFAEAGHHVACIDRNHEKIEDLKNGRISIYESGLEKLVTDNLAAGRLRFECNLNNVVEDSEIIFISVGTPTTSDGRCDLSYVRQVAVDIGSSLSDDYTVIATMSTVPVETSDEIERIISSLSNKLNFDVVSNPEFLQEGSAVSDRMNPYRIIVGSENEKATNIMKEFYAPFNSAIIITDRPTAELSKYACNAFLATKISFINEIATICEKVGADVTQISEIMGKDPRIGPHFLNAGIGYGGSCFPKDTKSLDSISNYKGHYFALLKSVIEVNTMQRQRLIEKISVELSSIRGRQLAVLGLAFKPNTDDIRDSISIDLIKDLIDRGASVRAHDPVAVTNASRILGKDICFDDIDTVFADADGIIVATEWPEYANIDLEKIRTLVRNPVIFDGRNIVDPKKAVAAGFTYYGMGRSSSKPFSDKTEFDQLSSQLIEDQSA